jgi:cell division protein FtsX
MRFMKKRKDIDMCNKLKLVASINGTSMIFIQMLIFLVGILFINNTIKVLEQCTTAKNFIEP